MAHPGLSVSTWAVQQGYVRPDRPATDALFIPRPTDLELSFVEVDDSGFLNFDFIPRRGVGEAPVLTGIDQQGFPYADLDGAEPGEEAAVSIDEDGFLDFTPLEA